MSPSFVAVSAVAFVVTTVWSLLSAHATGVALSSCRPSPQDERKMMAGLAAELKTALAKDDKHQLHRLLSDPLLVRLDGRKRMVPWKTVAERYDAIFGPRVRAAVDEGRLTLGRGGWKLGKSVVFLGLAQHGNGCGLEVQSGFEEPPPAP
jgi:hypothetical protein